MPRPPAIDVVIFPFTPETKVETYEHATVLKDSMIHLGIWEREFSAASFLADMDAAGVEQVLICAQEGGSWRVSYDYTRDYASADPRRLRWTAGIDPRDVMAGVRALERAVTEQGAVGAHSYPHWFRIPPDDRAYYPFYAKCVELGVPIQIQVGMAFQAGLRSVGWPGSIDQIAVDFPELAIVGIHPGYPWEREMISVAWKHPKVYIDCDCHHPRDFAPELVAFIKGAGRDKCMWGTNKPVFEFADHLAGVDALGLDEETERLFLYENVKRVYGL